MSEKKQIYHEILRKLIHLSSIWVPFSVYFLSYNYVKGIFLFSALLVITFDILRMSNGNMGDKIRKILNSTKFIVVFRNHERNRLSGASYMMASAAILLQFFNYQVFFISFLVLIISDTCAAIVGKSIGKYKIFNKTLEGSLAFFASAVLICICCIIFIPHFNYSLQSLFMASFVTTVIELISSKLKIDDNFTIPLCFGLIMNLLP